VAAVLVLNTPDDGRLRPKHVEWPCRNKTCTVLHQKSSHLLIMAGSPNKEMWWLTCNDNTCTSGRCTSFKYSWWWALASETCRVTLQKWNLHSVASSWCFIVRTPIFVWVPPEYDVVVHGCYRATQIGSNQVESSQDDKHPLLHSNWLDHAVKHKWQEIHAK